jgi:sarcosine oxidase subunit delta
MRIDCPYCGMRGNEEFAYLGDATVRRPQWGETEEAGPHADASAWHDYVYIRNNPAGPHKELWQHTYGCRQWLVVTRDTRSHTITAVEPARDAARTGAGAR